MESWHEGAGIGFNDARYLQITNNLSDLASVATARTTLGLVAGGAGDIWVEKAGDIMTGALINTLATGNSLVVDTTGLVYDATNNFVGIGTASPSSPLHIEFSSTGTGVDDAASLLIRNIDATASNRANIKFQMLNSSGTAVSGAFVSTIFTDRTAGAEDADLAFYARNNGNLQQFVTIKSSGYVGIGTADPQAPLQVVGQLLLDNTITGVSVPFTVVSNIATVPMFDTYNDTGGTTAQWAFRRAGGTYALPTDVLSGMDIGAFSFRGRVDGAFTSSQAKIIAEASENWVTGALGTRMLFQTTPLLSSTIATNLVIYNNAVGVGTSLTPIANLDVNSATGAILNLRNTDSSVVANDMIAKIAFVTNDVGTITNLIGAEIEAQSTNTIGGDLNPTRLIFRTTGTAVAAMPTERMRIDQAGIVSIGTYPTGADYDTNIPFVVNGANNNYFGLNVINNSTGAIASADVVVVNDRTDPLTNYGDFGINGSQWADPNFATFSRNAVFCWSAASDIYFGTGSSTGNIYFFAGGVNNKSYIKAILNTAGQLGLNVKNPTNRLEADGRVKAKSFEGDISETKRQQDYPQRTYSTKAPLNPRVGDYWIDIN